LVGIVSNAVISTTRTRNAVPAQPLAPAPVSRFSDSDVLLVFAVFLGVITAVWALNGGWTSIKGGLPHAWRTAASLSGMWTSAAGMVGLILAARVTWMERAIGLDRVLNWHRIAGDTMGVLLGIHVVTSVKAEMTLRGGLWSTIRDLTGRAPYMALTTIGAILVGVVVVTSLKSIRQKLAYETWYFVHLLAYLGLAMSFSHQITLGSLLANTTVVRWVWVMLSAFVFLFAIMGRWVGVYDSVRHPLVVQEVRRETKDTVSILIGGRNIERYFGEAGQFVSLRMLTPGQWWKTNPYSLSNAPTTRGMRITIKDRGDASGAVRQLRVGDRVAVEGPYGTMTPGVFHGFQPLFIAGGVGVTPVCAMLQALPADSRPIVLLRGAHTKDIPHYDEICKLAEARGGQVMTVLGRTAMLKTKDPFAGNILRKAVPTLDKCMAFVCGPTALTFAARKGLREAGLPADRIHLELPWW